MLKRPSPPAVVFEIWVRHCVRTSVAQRLVFWRIALLFVNVLSSPVFSPMMNSCHARYFPVALSLCAQPACVERRTGVRHVA